MSYMIHILEHEVASRVLHIDILTDVRPEYQQLTFVFTIVLLLLCFLLCHTSKLLLIARHSAQSYIFEKLSFHVLRSPFLCVQHGADDRSCSRGNPVFCKLTSGMVTWRSVMEMGLAYPNLPNKDVLLVPRRIDMVEKPEWKTEVTWRTGHITARTIL